MGIYEFSLCFVARICFAVRIFLLLCCLRLFLSSWKFFFCFENFSFPLRIFFVLFAMTIFLVLREFLFWIFFCLLLNVFFFKGKTFGKWCKNTVKTFLSLWESFFCCENFSGVWRIYLVLWKFFFLKLFHLL